MIKDKKEEQKDLLNRYGPKSLCNKAIEDKFLALCLVMVNGSTTLMMNGGNITINTITLVTQII